MSRLLSPPIPRELERPGLLVRGATELEDFAARSMAFLLRRLPEGTRDSQLVTSPDRKAAFDFFAVMVDAELC